MNRFAEELATLCVCFSLALGGCHEHVFLQVPTSQAPFAERAKAYQDLRPLHYQTSNRNGARMMDFLELANGTRVYYPDDLLVAVPSDSAAAQAVERSEALRKSASWFGLSTLACMVVGGTLIAVSTLGRERPDTGLLISGAAVGVVGGLTFGITSSTLSGRSVDQASVAYDHYDRALQRKLSVCVDSDCGLSSVHERISAP